MAIPRYMYCRGLNKGFGGSLLGVFRGINIGALIIRIWFWGPLYFNYNKETPK